MGRRGKGFETNLGVKWLKAEILETMSANCRDNYKDIMVALHHKFGDEHKSELYLMKLRCREG